MACYKKWLVVGAAFCVLAVIAYQQYQDYQLDQYRYEDEYWQPGLRQEIYTYSPKYLPRDFYIKLDPYPTNSSAETRREIEYLRSLESKRDDKTVALMDYEAAPKASLYKALNHEQIIPDDLYHIPEVIEAVMSVYRAEVSFFIMREKIRNMRPRAYHLDPTLNLHFPNPGHPAYPSGHSTQAHYMAFILAELFPEKAPALIESAGQIAYRREVAGVHYPSDSRAGKQLARQIVDGLLNHPEFNQIMENAKHAISKHRL